ncbi:MAG: hypothetical protein ACI9MC_004033 [Kiritimatiellia bacterium]
MFVRLLVPFLTMCSACASLAGVTELDGLPADFPLESVGELGVVSQTGVSTGGLIGTAADFSFVNEEKARLGYAKLLAEAEAEGWTRGESKADPEGWSFARGEGRLFVGCCLARADRRKLTIVNWHHKP